MKEACSERGGKSVPNINKSVINKHNNNGRRVYSLSIGCIRPSGNRICVIYREKEREREWGEGERERKKERETDRLTD